MITIEKVNVPGQYKNGLLTEISFEEIEYVLGMPNIQDDPGKVKHSWGFMASLDNGISYACGIWSWKGSEQYNEWSYSGPKFVFDALFGKHHIQPIKMKE